MSDIPSSNGSSLIVIPSAGGLLSVFDSLSKCWMGGEELACCWLAGGVSDALDLLGLAGVCCLVDPSLLPLGGFLWCFFLLELLFVALEETLAASLCWFEPRSCGGGDSSVLASSFFLAGGTFFLANSFMLTCLLLVVPVSLDLEVGMVSVGYLRSLQSFFTVSQLHQLSFQPCRSLHAKSTVVHSLPCNLPFNNIAIIFVSLVQLNSDTFLSS